MVAACDRLLTVHLTTSAANVTALSLYTVKVYFCFLLFIHQFPSNV